MKDKELQSAIEQHGVEPVEHSVGFDALAVSVLSDLANKRFLAWISWRAKRRSNHRSDVLHAALEDLEGLAADHVAVTGDVTNAALASEFEEALPWLERLGGPEQVSWLPGTSWVRKGPPTNSFHPRASG